MPIFGTIRISFCILTLFSKNKIKHDKISIHEAQAEQTTFCSDLFIKHFLCVELNATTYVMNKLA